MLAGKCEVFLRVWTGFAQTTLNLGIARIFPFSVHGIIESPFRKFQSPNMEAC